VGLWWGCDQGRGNKDFLFRGQAIFGGHHRAPPPSCLPLFHPPPQVLGAAEKTKSKKSKKSKRDKKDKKRVRGEDTEPTVTGDYTEPAGHHSTATTATATGSAPTHKAKKVRKSKKAQQPRTRTGDDDSAPADAPEEPAPDNPAHQQASQDEPRKVRRVGEEGHSAPIAEPQAVAGGVHAAAIALVGGAHGTHDAPEALAPATLAEAAAAPDAADDGDVVEVVFHTPKASAGRSLDVGLGLKVWMCSC
jgi:hypothetical protein